MARNIREPIPLPVILAASEGDERALNAVLNHYKGYIRFLAMRRKMNMATNTSMWTKI